MSSVDRIIAGDVGEELFDLRVTSHPRGAVIATFETVVVAVDYARAGAVGPVLPLEVLVTTLADRRAHERARHVSVAPSQVILRPTEAGEWLVVVREIAHNRWWGALRLSVVGSRA